MKIMPYTQEKPHVFDTGIMKGVKGRVVIGKADGAHNCMRVFEDEPLVFVCLVPSGAPEM